MALAVEAGWDYGDGREAPTVSAVLAEQELVGCIESRRPAFRRMAAAMLGDEWEADDIVQNAALSAIRARPQFRGESDVCTWFHRICLNACYQARRRRERSRVTPAPDDYVARWRDPSYTVDPERVAVAAEDGRRLRAALDQLPPNHRMAVVLHDAEGWSSGDIATTVGLPVATVKSHLRRGRMALVSMLAEDGHDVNGHLKVPGFGQVKVPTQRMFNPL